MVATMQITTDETTEAREQTAARVERLAELVRNSEGASLAQLDAAYSMIVKLAGEVRQVLHS